MFSRPVTLFASRSQEEDVSPLAMALTAREKVRYEEKFSHQRESVRDGVTLFRPGRRRGFPRDGRGQRGPRREAAVAAVHLRTEGPRPW